uniref:F-box domain-containing protein n=1 Tax=Panagrellus redivivus TaxID=6233 RepID=A0A7E4UNG0_PANRE
MESAKKMDSNSIRQNLTIPYPLLKYIVDHAPGDVAQKMGSTCKYLTGMVERTRSGNLPPKLLDYIIRKAPARTLNKMISYSKYLNERSYYIRGRAIDCLAVDMDSTSEVHTGSNSGEVVLWMGKNHADVIDKENICLDGALEVYCTSRIASLPKILNFRYLHITRLEFYNCKLKKVDFFALTKSEIVQEVITDCCEIRPNPHIDEVLKTTAHVKKLRIDIPLLKYSRKAVHPLVAWERSCRLESLTFMRLKRDFTVDTCVEVIEKHGGPDFMFHISFTGKTPEEHNTFESVMNARIQQAQNSRPDDLVGLPVVREFRCEPLIY